MENYDLVLIKPIIRNMYNPFGSLTLSLIMLQSWLQYHFDLNVKVIHMDEYENNYSVIPEAPVYGLGISTPQVPEAKDIYRYLKDTFKGCTVIGGGAHPSAIPYHSLETPLCDVVIRGYGEEALSVYLKNGVDFDYMITKDHPDYSPELDSSKSGCYNDRLELNTYKDVPMCYYDINQELVYKWVVTNSIGCPYRCNYCFRITDKIYDYPREFVFRCIEDAYKLRGKVKPIFFLDEDIFYRFEEKLEYLEFTHRLNLPFCCHGRPDRITYEQAKILKNLGCTDVRIGIETGSPALLKKMNKSYNYKKVEEGCAAMHEADLRFSFYLLSDYPGETEEDLKKTIEFVKRTKPYEVKVSSYIPLPGSSDWYGMPLEEREKLYERWDDFYFAGEFGQGGLEISHCKILRDS
ncbi:MAG: B12-binding domain-containing radical SAM protein, partial [Candidatus Latescibacteria bacterium]|nr:B12-binding domain-containing radical SAM protein [Candidatus Latescibacterota bacterium]